MNPGKRLPVATLFLIAANVGIAYFSLVQPGVPAEYGFRAQNPNVVSAFASMFIHSNIVHLLGNMLFLAAVGATVEQLSGSLRFVLVYFASGLGGVAAHWAMGSHGGVEVPLVGASGCIAGCASYYSVRYLKLRLPITEKLRVNVAAVTVVWLALQAMGAFVSIGQQKPVTAFWAHIGGFLVGILLSVAFRSPDIGKIEADAQLLRQMGERSPGALLAEAEQQLKENPKDPRALQEAAQVYAELGDFENERLVRYRLFDVLAEADQRRVVHRLCELDGAAGIPVLKRLMLAERLKANDPSASRELLLTVLNESSAESQWPDTLLALASIEAESDPVQSKALLARLEVDYPLHPATELARAKGLL